VVVVYGAWTNLVAANSQLRKKCGGEAAPPGGGRPALVVAVGALLGRHGLALV
jgi:hypothetical protein